MSSPTYKPVYMTDEEIGTTIISVNEAPKLTEWQVNPQYCLARSSADQLLAILQAAYPQYSIVLDLNDYPTPIAPGSPDAYNLTVPWIIIANKGGGQDGADAIYRMNAGQFSAYWASAPEAAQGQSNNPDVAWRNAQQDIAEGLAYTGGN